MRTETNEQPPPRVGDRVSSAVTGMLTAGFLLVFVYGFPGFHSGNPWPAAMGLVAYALAMVSLGLWQGTSASGSAGRRTIHRRSLVVSELLLGVGVAISAVEYARDPWFWIPFAAVTALPLLVAAWWTPKPKTGSQP